MSKVYTLPDPPLLSHDAGNSKARGSDWPWLRDDPESLHFNLLTAALPWAAILFSLHLIRHLRHCSVYLNLVISSGQAVPPRGWWCHWEVFSSCPPSRWISGEWRWRHRAAPCTPRTGHWRRLYIVLCLPVTGSPDTSFREKATAHCHACMFAE